MSSDAVDSESGTKKRESAADHDDDGFGKSELSKEQRKQVRIANRVRDEELDEEEKAAAKKKKRKPRTGCRRLKECVRRCADRREKCEDHLNDKVCPYVCQPLLGCLCIGWKWNLLGYATQLLIPLLCVVGVVTAVLRCLHCPFGKDLLYSTLELCEELEECIDIFYDNHYWRKDKEKREAKLLAKKEAKREQKRLKQSDNNDKSTAKEPKSEGKAKVDKKEKKSKKKSDP